jgi:hypothetical protein
LSLFLVLSVYGKDRQGVGVAISAIIFKDCQVELVGSSKGVKETSVSSKGQFQMYHGVDNVVGQASASETRVLRFLELWGQRGE